VKLLSDGPSGWDYYLSFSFLFGAALLRAILLYYSIPEALFLSLALLAVWFILFLSQPALSKRWPNYFIVYLVIQTGLAFRLLFNPEPADFFALLFAFLSAQIMWNFQPRTGMLYIALFTPLSIIPLIPRMGVPMSIFLSLIYLAGNALLASYALASRRAQAARAQNQATLKELEEANRVLLEYSQNVQQLAVARERNRLARELHDSVTQSIFSMTLATQSASLLFKRDPDRVREQLIRMGELAQSALVEMQTLISELNPQKITEGGLASALRQHIAGRRLPDGLMISIDAQGDLPLSIEEELGLFRIVQESLNNIIKHSTATQATVKLHLAEPLWVEITDNGRGFDLQRAQQGKGIGLASMRERAAEIGWPLQIITSPGSGACVRLEKSRTESLA
jgi:signal transduction histidine kinase